MNEKLALKITVSWAVTLGLGFVLGLYIGSLYALDLYERCMSL